MPDTPVSHGQQGCLAVELLGVSPGTEAPGHRPNAPASLLKRCSEKPCRTRHVRRLSSSLDGRQSATGRLDPGGDPQGAVNDDDWYMGSLNDDGSVTCWSAYSDLYEALRGL